MSYVKAPKKNYMKYGLHVHHGFEYRQHLMEKEIYERKIRVAKTDTDSPGLVIVDTIPAAVYLDPSKLNYKKKVAYPQHFW